MKCVHVVALAIEAVAAATSHTCLKVMLPQRRGAARGEDNDDIACKRHTLQGLRQNRCSGCICTPKNLLMGALHPS